MVIFPVPNFTLVDLEVEVLLLQCLGPSLLISPKTPGCPAGVHSCSSCMDYMKESMRLEPQHSSV